jgi:non-ribosomal peptide synthetase component F
MARHFECLLRAAAANPDTPIGDLDLFDAMERRRILVDWNATDADYPADTSIVALVRQRVAAAPEATAFIDGDARLTFAELEVRSNQIANRLTAFGVGRGMTVGVYLDRSFALVEAMLATWKVGGIYVPLDPGYPAERLAFMARDCGAKVVISRSELSPLPGLTSVSFLCLDLEAALLRNEGAVVPDATAGPDAPSHLIYTSGSTGTPKGALSAHRQILNRLHWMWRAYPQVPGEVGLVKTATSFIDSLWELLGPLLAGQPSVLVPRAYRSEPRLTM